MCDHTISWGVAHDHTITVKAPCPGCYEHTTSSEVGVRSSNASKIFSGVEVGEEQSVVGDDAISLVERRRIP